MKYYNGTIINNILLVERLHKKGYALFQCPFCNTIFEAKISHIVDKRIMSCGDANNFIINITMAII